MSDKHKLCQWPKCQSESEIIYLDCGLCEKHWEKVCDMSKEDISKKLDIKEENQTDIGAKEEKV